MSNVHWTDDQLIEHLYGLGPDISHLERCVECAARWRALETSRQRLLNPTLASEEFLAGQRRAIYGCLEHGAERPWWLQLAATAAASAAVVLLALLLHRPAPAPYSGLSDAELYAEVYSLVQSDEPLAILPVHAIFEVE